MTYRALREIEGRKLSLAEAQSIRGAQHLVAEQLERNGGLAPNRVRNCETSSPRMPVAGRFKKASAC